MFLTGNEGLSPHYVCEVLGNKGVPAQSPFEYFAAFSTSMPCDCLLLFKTKRSWWGALVLSLKGHGLEAD